MSKQKKEQKMNIFTTYRFKTKEYIDHSATVYIFFLKKEDPQKHSFKTGVYDFTSVKTQQNWCHGVHKLINMLHLSQRLTLAPLTESALFRTK